MLTVVLLIIIAILIIADFIIANLLYNLALNPHGDKSKVFDGMGFVFENDHPGNLFKEIAPEDVFIKADNGLKLHSFVVEHPEEEHSDKWLIGVHGYMGDAREMGWRNCEFYTHGYNVLFPDNRGHGQSEGDYVGMGWDDRLDIVCWIRYLVEKYPGCQIVLFGVSMGGATVMMTAGEELPDNVKAIVEDCGYSSILDEFKYEAKCLFHIPYFPLVATANLLTKIRAGYSFQDGSSVRQLKKAKAPMLFIHGDSDVFVPSSMLDVVYDAAVCQKEKLIIKGAGHALAMDTDPKLYWDTIFAFLGKYVK